MTDKLSRVSAASTRRQDLPACPLCGAAIGFVASPGGSIEWWRCTGCQHFYPVRSSHCSHDPGIAGRCARCGGTQIAITITLRESGNEITMHFCSISHARESLGDHLNRQET
jgi:hypothetical protein